MEANQIQNNPNWYLVLGFIKGSLLDQVNERHIPIWDLTDLEDKPIDLDELLYTQALPHLLEHNYLAIYIQMDDTEYPRISIEKATSHNDLITNYYPLTEFDGDITEGHTIATDINGTFYHIAYILD